jgi:4,5-DOPA dioxygenase extradiol
MEPTGDGRGKNASFVHGAWSVLRHMYPQANVPAFQLSRDERRGFYEHLDLGREMRTLRSVEC